MSPLPSSLPWRSTRVVAVVVAVLVLAGACSGGSGEDSALSTTTAVPTTVTTIVVPVPETTIAPVETTTSVVLGLGMPAGGLFLDLDREAMDYVPLDDATQAELEARFGSDDRVKAFLNDVAAVGVQLEDRLGAVVVSVSVSPPVAADIGFAQSFLEGVTAAAVEGSLEETIVGNQELLRFRNPDGVRSMVWRYDNLYAVISGRDDDDVLAVTEALVDAHTDSVPDPIPCPPTPEELAEREAAAGAEGSAADGSTTTAPTASTTTVGATDAELSTPTTLDCIPVELDTTVEPPSPDGAPATTTSEP